MSDALNGMQSLRQHWPEYLIEAWALGFFMLSAGVSVVLIETPIISIPSLIPDADIRRALIGLAMGITAIVLIYSPWGKRSGAHMNPAVTLTFLRLGKVKRWDAVFYILAQYIGGVIGVILVIWLFGSLFTEPPALYVVTVPGAEGVGVAYAAEVLLSSVLMLTILMVSNNTRFEQWTGLAAGLLVASFITFEAPLSGMSINPARTFASAFPADIWTAWWLYMTAPIVGMLLGAEAYIRCFPGIGVCRAKLVWCDDQRCIHSGYEPKNN